MDSAPVILLRAVLSLPRPGGTGKETITLSIEVIRAEKRPNPDKKTFGGIYLLKQKRNIFNRTNRDTEQMAAPVSTSTTLLHPVGFSFPRPGTAADDGDQDGE
jgi:hypothetical protein